MDKILVLTYPVHMMINGMLTRQADMDELNLIVQHELDLRNEGWKVMSYSGALESKDSVWSVKILRK